MTLLIAVNTQQVKVRCVMSRLDGSSTMQTRLQVYVVLIKSLLGFRKAHQFITLVRMWAGSIDKVPMSFFHI